MGEQPISISGRDAKGVTTNHAGRLARVVLAFAAIHAGALIAFAAPPKVIKAMPDNGDADVDPSLKEYRIEFDQDMSVNGWSFCGTGPEVTGKPRWVTKRVLVVAVSLEPGHSYRFSINCPAGMNCRSASGEPAEIYPISFSTASAGGSAGKNLSKDVNAKSISELERLIDEEYAYRELQGVDWQKAFKQSRTKLAAAKTPAEFARIAARLLAPAKDVHLSLQAGVAPFATFQRKYTPNFNFKLLEETVPQWQKRSDCVFSGRFDDGIALLVTWGPAKPADVEPPFGPSLISSAPRDSSSTFGRIRRRRNSGEISPVVSSPSRRSIPRRRDKEAKADLEKSSNGPLAE
jgi:hypothetical protein